MGFDPCPTQPLKARAFQIKKRVGENKTDRGFHFSLGSHLFNPLLLALDATEMGSKHQNPGTAGAPGPHKGRGRGQGFPATAPWK